MLTASPDPSERYLYNQDHTILSLGVADIDIPIVAKDIGDSEREVSRYELV